ncbi:hypothetical protein C0991_000139 [Blastosporella zonata]|nr:hypothetical protein C0991_000139 [Blastosporella zonata]
MAQREAHLRRIEAKDEKLVRFSIGKAAMESLAVANRRAYIHPITVSAWLLLTYSIINTMDLWPDNHHGILGYLKPIPIVAASLVPIMVLIDWLNRPDFEKETYEVLHGPDMSDLVAHYSRHPASGLWIIEFGGLFVGFIALDATPESAPKEGKKQPKGSSASAVIRHFYVDEPYRSSGIQEDLLSHVLQLAFTTEPALKVVKASDSQLFPYIGNCLQGAGFVREESTQKVGVFGWQLGKRSLSREEWEKKTK